MTRRDTVLESMSDEQLAHALEVTEAHLAKRPSWRIGEGVVRMLVGEQTRRARTKERAA